MVVIDISMPFMDGIEATKQIKNSCPSTRVLALSIYDNQAYIEGALQAGAHGYVLKDAIATELLDAIRSLHEGKRYFSQKIVSVIYPLERMIRTLGSPKLSLYCNHFLRRKMNSKLLIRNLAYSTTEDELLTLFTLAGTVISVDIMRDRVSGRSQGYGFIQMSNLAEAERAVEMFNGWKS